MLEVRYQHQSTDIRAPEKLNLQRALRHPWYRAIALLGSDMTALALAWQLAGTLNQYYSPIPPQLVWWVWLGLPSLFWVFATITLLLFVHAGLYSSFTQWRNYVRSGQLVSVVYLLSLVSSYFYDPKLDPPRSLFFTAWLGSVVFVVLFRLTATLILRQVEQSQPPVSVFLIAPAERLNKLIEAIERRGMRMNGLTSHRIVGTSLASTVHSEVTLQTILTSGAQEVIAEELPRSDLASTLYWQLRRAGITLRLVPGSLEMLHRRGVPETFAGLPTLRIESPLLGGWDYCLKRWIDYLAAFLGLVVLLPVFLGVAIALKLASPGPVFFRQERVGLHGQIFWIWKFRTMVPHAPALQSTLELHNQTDGVHFKLKHDPRVTPIGRLLRRTSLDELPQLFNVLLGQMSLVGPRPLPLRDIEHFQPWHHARHQVLPGMTGLWQVSGRSDINDFDDAARLDLYYIDNWSLNLDLDILVETLRIMLFNRGAY